MDSARLVNLQNHNGKIPGRYYIHRDACEVRDKMADGDKNVLCWERRLIYMKGSKM